MWEIIVWSSSVKEKITPYSLPCYKNYHIIHFHNETVSQKVSVQWFSILSIEVKWESIYLRNIFKNSENKENVLPKHSQ